MIPFRYIDASLAFLGFVFLIGALNALLTTFDSTVGGSDSGGNMNIQLLSMAIYGPTVFLIVHRLEKFLHLLSMNVILLLFLILPILSVTWSLAPDVTARRVIAFAGTTLFIGYIAIAFSPQQSLRILAVAFGVTAIISLVFAIALPSLGTHEAGPYIGVWRGVFAHKNKLGGMMALAAATIIVCPKYNKRERISARLGASIAVFLVIMSQSKTALVILCFILVLIPFGYWISGRGLRTVERIIFFSIFSSLILVVVTRNAEFILDLLGKDMTFTGRTETWSMAWDNVLKHPVFGHGYRVFWSDKSPERLAAVEGWRDKISHSHNTYLDLALDLGFAGVFGFLVILFIFFFRLMKKIRREKDGVNLWMLTFSAYMLIVGITERSVLEQSDIVWAVFVLSYLYLSRYKVDKVTQELSMHQTLPFHFQPMVRSNHYGERC